MSPTVVIACAHACHVGTCACVVVHSSVHPPWSFGSLFHRWWRRRRWAQMFALGGLLIAPGLHAETDLTELPLEQLMQVQVSSASKYAQPASEAPASMSVITAA
ncbi:TonB-dependent receptor, partial [Ralstonia pseudosolanacearum]